VPGGGCSIATVSVEPMILHSYINNGKYFSKMVRIRQYFVGSQTIVNRLGVYLYNDNR
jgi:hypothetical protein